jgi:hypothetical protein
MFSSCAWILLHWAGGRMKYEEILFSLWYVGRAFPESAAHEPPKVFLTKLTMLLGTELGLVGIKCDRNEVLVVSGSTKRNWARTLFKLFIVVPICIVVAVVNAGFLLGTYMYFARDLPTVSELERYEPKVPCRVTDSSEGRKELKFHCRAPEFPVEVDRLPQHVVNAFLAAEDTSFMERGVPSFATMLFHSFVVIGFRTRWRPSPFTRSIARGLLPR